MFTIRRRFELVGAIYSVEGGNVSSSKIDKVVASIMAVNHMSVKADDAAVALANNRRW